MATPNQGDLNEEIRNREKELLEATKAGDCEKAIRLLSTGLNPNLTFDDGRTLLSTAAALGHFNLMNRLLGRKGIDPDHKCNAGRTALAWAIIFLGCRKAGVRRPYRNSNSSSDFAHVKRLYTCSIDIDCKDNKGRTPFSLAAGYDLIDIVRLLLNAKSGVTINSDSRDQNGRTPLGWAAYEAKPNMVKLLLDQRDINRQSVDDDEQTPLSCAIDNKDTISIRLLIPRDTCTMHLLVRRTRIESLKYLLQQGYPVNTKDLNGRTALHLAAFTGKADIVNALIDLGADVQCRDFNGWTPLRAAVQKQHRDVVKMLLEHSADARGIMKEDWHRIYTPRDQAVLEFSENPEGVQSIQSTEHVRGSLTDEPGRTRRLMLFRDYYTWSTSLVNKIAWKEQESGPRLIYKIQNHAQHVSIVIRAKIPTALQTGHPERFSISYLKSSGIAWTMSYTSDEKGRERWSSIDHFSMLPYGWVPRDGSEFFLLFVKNMRKEWQSLFILAEEHMTNRRLHQLDVRGEDHGLIHRLAKDDQEWAGLRKCIQTQIRPLKNFISRYRDEYDQWQVTKEMQGALDDLALEVGERIDQLDQTVQRLLQFEFSWVTIDEAHKSTSIATSIKRLSWITFVYLPLMFASSLFGMNVDILKSNPDWRWYVLFGGGFSVITVMVWLIFKSGQLEKIVKGPFATRLRHWPVRSKKYDQDDSKIA